MVLFKRRPVVLTSPPTNIPDNAEVWPIEATGEVFLDYEKFLKRMDFLLQKAFTDAVNGKSGLTYFDAYEMESQSSRTIDELFPEVLRDPILRKVQFSTVGRMDDLVNLVYDEFKRDFFPTEQVIVIFPGGDTLPGTVREKAKFPVIRGPDGSVQREAFSRYFVRLPSNPNEEVLADDKHIRRDKKIFTKQNLRSFLKHSLQREAWNGAPWLVKEHLAVQYHLPMEIPAHLLQDFKVLQSRQTIPQTKPGKARRSKLSINEDIIRLDSEEPVPEYPASQTQLPGQSRYTAQPLPKGMTMQFSKVAHRPAPPLKYPIEDLDVPPKRNGVTRPQLKFFTEEMDEYIKSDRKKPLTGLQFESLSMLLESWTTINVQAEVYSIDSFTFDDFIDAMKFSSTDVECELLNEMFCGLLKTIVEPNGRVEVQLPEIYDDDSTEGSEIVSSSEPSTPVEASRPARNGGRGIKVEEPAVKTVPQKLHRANDILADFDWQDHLAARDVEHGGWQTILVGLLHQLSYSPTYKQRADAILAALVPLDTDPSRASIRRNFAAMDINLRASALQILSSLSVATKRLRDFLETCSEDQTMVRKVKIENQRERKVVIEELNIKEKERRLLLPDDVPMPSPEEEVAEPDTTIDEISETDPDEDMTHSQSQRRVSGRKRKRDEEQARVQKEKEEKAAAAETKQSKELAKVTKEVERLRAKLLTIESTINDCDMDLREANVQRTRVLGIDRYCNRYYWFERNGQPFGGLPSSSTAHYGYSNGFLWVQGPTELERQGFIDLPADQQAEYRSRFQMTVPERRRQEEGATSLKGATEWGYYDNSDRIDSLIAWLDDRGDREKKLLKELRDWRDEIVKYMEVRKKFLEEDMAKRAEAEEEQATRISTRHAIQKDKVMSAERCLRWHNSMAVTEEKQLHSLNPPKSKFNKKAAPKGVAQVVSRAGKPVTRQGAAHASR